MENWYLLSRQKHPFTSWTTDRTGKRNWSTGQLEESTKRKVQGERLHHLVIALRASSLVAARRALILFDVFSSGRGDLHTLAMEPLLTDVTANPEFIWCIVLTTSTAQSLTMLIFFFLIQALVFLRLWWF